ncbi:MAG: hypothetical protein P3A28_08295 [Gemmatimonadota bacterium]|nr:hypothetical protein [Gemmatimonadota bacterium]
MLRIAAGVFLLASTACGTRGSVEFTAEHARSIRDSVAAFLSAEARTLSSAPTVAQIRAKYHDSVGFVADVDPANPILLLGMPPAPDTSAPALPAHIRSMSFHYDSLEIVPLAPGVASVLGLYREEITDSTGQRTTTRAGIGLVLQNGPSGWRIRHATTSHPDSATAAWNRLEARFAKPAAP